MDVTNVSVLRSEAAAQHEAIKRSAQEFRRAGPSGPEALRGQPLPQKYPQVVSRGSYPEFEMCNASPACLHPVF